MGKKILIVDDDRMNVALMQFAFKIGDYEVVTAQDGAGGIEAFKKESPALIVLDIYMPGMSGFEFMNDEIKDLARLATQFYRAGGIVTLSDWNTLSDTARYVFAEAGAQHRTRTIIEYVLATIDPLVATKSLDDGETFERMALRYAAEEGSKK